jgi:hypothetical protein
MQSGAFYYLQECLLYPFSANVLTVTHLGSGDFIDLVETYDASLGASDIPIAGS